MLPLLCKKKGGPTMMDGITAGHTTGQKPNRARHIMGAQQNCGTSKERVSLMIGQMILCSTGGKRKEGTLNDLPTIEKRTIILLDQLPNAVTSIKTT
jgi:hypothetical protein